ncbi:plasmid mobilization protein [Rhizobium sp. 21-4511-3d]
MLTIDGPAVDGACGASGRGIALADGKQKALATRRVGERKSRVVHARFSMSELAAVEDAAQRAGMTVSAFIRSLTLDGAGILPFLTDEDRAVLDLLHRDLRAIGVNLNSLVRFAHQRSMPADAADLLSELSPLVAGLALELRRLSTRPGRTIEGLR